MSGERVLLLGGRLDFVRKAAECGLDVVNVQKTSSFDPGLLEHCRQLHVMDYQDIPQITALAEALHQVRPFSRVVTQTEAAVVVAGHLTTHLGLPGNSVDTVRTLHDKRSLRRLLNARGIGEVAFQSGDSREDLLDFVRRHGPAVMKPSMGSGSLGVRRVLSLAEVEDAWRWAEELRLTEFMVEELLTGREISVETYSSGGSHTVLGITGKDTGGGVVEVGHVLPARLSAQEARQVIPFVSEVLNAVDLVEGLAHTELILTADGPRVVESHSRLGGDRINELVRLVLGVDMEELALRATSPRGGTLSLPAPDGAAASRFLIAEPGRVVSVDGVDEARALPGVQDVRIKVAPGDVVRPLQWSEDRCGHVVVHAADAATAERLAREAVEVIRVRTVPDDSAVAAPLAHRLTEVDEILDPFADGSAVSVHD
jgi:biotin carboxylase